jgi:prepilin-type N-terminal cleavage/methylation domain-containing protein
MRDSARRYKGWAENAPAPKAFTLVELLVVITVLALLLALLMPAFLEAARSSWPRFLTIAASGKRDDTSLEVPSSEASSTTMISSLEAG